MTSAPSNDCSDSQHDADGVGGAPSALSEPRDDTESNAPAGPVIPKENWWKHRPDQLDLAIMAGKSFVRGEWNIIEQHLAHYITLGRTERNPFLVNTVIVEVRKFWGTKFSKKNLDRDENLRNEWAKKRKVITSCDFIHTKSELLT